MSLAQTVKICHGLLGLREAQGVNFPGGLRTMFLNRPGDCVLFLF